MKQLHISEAGFTEHLTDFAEPSQTFVRCCSGVIIRDELRPKCLTETIKQCQLVCLFALVQFVDRRKASDFEF